MLGVAPAAGSAPQPEPKNENGVSSSIPTGRLYARLLVVAGIVVALDQVSKSLALELLSDGPVDVIEGAITLQLSFNSGGAFGLLQELPELFLAATVAVVAAILIWARRLQDARWLVPLGLVLGGGLGNLADRLVRGHAGRVVDFIDLQVWPVFNLADSAIVIGVGLVLVLGLRPGSDGRGAPPD
jgi:signal peptidase II